MKSEISRLELIEEYEKAPDSALFSQETVAAILDCSEATLERERWVGSGIPFIKVGRRVRYRKSDIQLWLNGRSSFRSTTQAQQHEKENNKSS
jgi:hypothetical protein